MSPRAAARCAYGAAIGGSLADLLFTGLHTLDGLLILGIAGFLYASARRWRS